MLRVVQLDGFCSLQLRERAPRPFRYIEGWFNPRWRHSTLGYLSPADYEQAHQEMIAATATTPAELTTEHADRAPIASSP